MKKIDGLELAAAAIGAAVGLRVARGIEKILGVARAAFAEGSGVVQRILDESGVVAAEVKEDPTGPIRPPLR
jgi:hypothetical protein